MKNYKYVDIYDYVYNTISLGLMTSKNEDEARSYLDRQLYIASLVQFDDIRFETLAAIDAARSRYNSIYSRNI